RLVPARRDRKSDDDGEESSRAQGELALKERDGHPAATSSGNDSRTKPSNSSLRSPATSACSRRYRSRNVSSSWRAGSAVAMPLALFWRSKMFHRRRWTTVGLGDCGVGALGCEADGQVGASLTGP